MPEQIEVAPSESAVVTMNGGVLPALRGPGRPRNNPEVVPSQRQKAAESLRRQDINLTAEEFAKVWQKYCELRKVCLPSQIPTYWIWACSGCRDSDGQRDIPNGRHRPACNGVNAAAEILWPGDVTWAVAEAKGITTVNLPPAQAAQRKLKFWETEAGAPERRKELAAAVEWLKQHDCGDPATWVTREHLLHFVGLAGLVGIPKVFDAETEEALAAALAAK